MIINIDFIIYILMIAISIVTIIISVKLLKNNSKHYVAKSIQGVLYIIAAIIVIIFCLINLLQTG